jgi:excisionase family DNA binding protein
MAEYLTVREAAQRYRVTTWLLYKLAADRKLPHARIGAAIRFDAAELDAFLRGQRGNGASAGEFCEALGTQQHRRGQKYTSPGCRFDSYAAHSA